MRLRRNILALALLAGSLVAALAGKLDKTACNDLNAELAGIVASGVREDMGRGPAWAKSNLPPERLWSIRRLLEVEEQLQFRCGTGSGKALATSPAKPPAKSAGEDDTKKLNPPAKSEKTGVTNSTRMAGAPVVPPLINAPAKAPEKHAPATLGRRPAPSITVARTEPPPAVPAAVPSVQMAPRQGVAPARVPDTKPATRFNAAKLAIIAALPPQPLPQEDEAKVSLGLKATALSVLRPRAPGPRRKAPRRDTTYVSPGDVNPYFVTRYGTTR